MLEVTGNPNKNGFILARFKNKKKSDKSGFVPIKNIVELTNDKVSANVYSSTSIGPKSLSQKDIISLPSLSLQTKYHVNNHSLGDFLFSFLLFINNKKKTEQKKKSQVF